MGEIKYSFLIPYFNRKSFHNTLVSWDFWYKDRKDWEVLIVEDSKTDSEHHYQLLEDLNAFLHLPLSYTTLDNENGYTGVKLFNFSAKIAHGDYFILTNPECIHSVDILAGLDRWFADGASKYVLCAVLNIQDKGLVSTVQELLPVSQVPIGGTPWLQHSVHNPRCLHFCSCVPKDLYFKVGGFDEEYSKGTGYDDNDFLQLILQTNTPIIQDDSLVAWHQDHSRGYQALQYTLTNQAYYLKKWGVR